MAQALGYSQINDIEACKAGIEIYYKWPNILSFRFAMRNPFNCGMMVKYYTMADTPSTGSGTKVGHYNHAISNKKADTQVPPLLLNLYFYSITVQQSHRDVIFV